MEEDINLKVIFKNKYFFVCCKMLPSSFRRRKYKYFMHRLFGLSREENYYF